LTDIHG
jgi:SpoVK/Ycf46/Vps4 family AAA+-type ATPase